MNESPEALKERLRQLDRLFVQPEVAAERYLRGLRRNRAVIIGSPAGTLLWWLHRLSPALTERLLGRREMRRFLARTDLPPHRAEATGSAR